MGVGFWRYDMTTAEMESMKLDMICLVSSLYLVLAKLMQEQYTATQPHHLILANMSIKSMWPTRFPLWYPHLIMRAHIENIMPRTFM